MDDPQQTPPGPDQDQDGNQDRPRPANQDINHPDNKPKIDRFFADLADMRRDSDRTEQARAAIRAHILPALRAALNEADYAAVITELVCLLTGDSTADYGADFAIAEPGDLEPGAVGQFFKDRRPYGQ